MNENFTKFKLQKTKIGDMAEEKKFKIKKKLKKSISTQTFTQI